MRTTSTSQPDLETLKDYHPDNPGSASREDYNASIINGLRGQAEKMLHDFAHIKPEEGNTIQAAHRAIAFEEIDLWIKTTWREMASAFGVKKYAPPTHGVDEGAIVYDRTENPASAL